MTGKILSLWPTTLIVALLAGLLIAGCGGDGKGSEATEASLRKLNSLCRIHNRKAASKLLTAYDDPRVKHASTEGEAINLEVDLFVPILLADAEAQARAIRNARLPSDDEQVKAILGAYRGWISRAERAPLRAVRANDVYNEARKLAASYGLGDCGLSPFEAGTQPGAAPATQTG